MSNEGNDGIKNEDYDGHYEIKCGYRRDAKCKMRTNIGIKNESNVKDLSVQWRICYDQNEY